MWDRTLDFMLQGGPVMLPLFAVAVLSFALLFDRWRYFRAAGSPDAEPWLAAVQPPHSTSPAAPPLPTPASPGLLPQFLAATVHSADWLRTDREATCRRQEIEFREQLDRGLLVLGMLAALAPLLGLLGTVTGMISTFQIMAAQGVADSRGLSLGIAEALITTEVGLSIALLTLVGRRYVLARAERFQMAIRQLTVAALTQPHTGAAVPVSAASNRPEAASHA